MDGSRHRAEYLRRIHRVQDHIEKNLGGELRLEELARVACFSPFHFHRVFAAVTGETLHQFITRLRLSRAATELVSKPSKSVTAIALDSGWSSSAVFARAFRATFGQSASEYRARGGRGAAADRKNRKTLRKEGKAAEGRALHDALVDATASAVLAPSAGERGSPMMTMKTAPKPADSVAVQDCPAFTVAYIRHVGPYAGDAGLFERLFEQLMRWAGPRGLLAAPDARMLCIYHDPPGITDEEKLRLSVCVSARPDTRPDGEVGVMEVPAGRYAFARFALDASEYGAAWDWVCGTWLPSSGYQPSDGPMYELYRSRPEKPGDKAIVDIVIPVEPL